MGTVLAQFVFATLPVDRDPGVYRPTLGSEADGRLKQFAQTLRAMGSQQGLPGIHRAGNGDGVRRGRLYFSDALAFEPVDRVAGGRAARAVQGHNLAGTGGSVEAEAITADAGGLRLDHAEHGNGGDSGVHRIAAGAQHVQRS